jgi:hypothetical protein
VHKDKRVLFVLLGAFGWAAFGLIGCGGDARSDLAKATNRARRLCDRACAVLHDPVFKVGGDYAPFTERKDVPDDPNAIELVPLGMVNPKAAPALKQAASELSAALAAADSDTPPVDKALAHAVLARIHALEGDRRALLATQKRHEAWNLLRRMEDAAIAMADHGKRVANCDQLLSVTDPSVAKMASGAKADIAAAQTKIGEMTRKMQAHEKEKTSLATANEKLLADARELRVQSQLAGPIKGIELFDKARAKEDQATANSVRITELEDTVQFLASQIATRKLDVAAAQRRGTAAAEVAGRREKRTATIRQERDAFVQLVTDSQKEVETLAGKTIDLCKQARDEEDGASKAYGSAEAQYKNYAGCTGDKAPMDVPELDSDPAIVSMWGDMRMQQGQLRLATLSLQKRLDHVVAGVTKLWEALPVQNTVPDIVTQVPAYRTNAQEMKTAAQEDFRWAAIRYEDAAKLLDRKGKKKLQWAYHLQTAAAYAAHYRLSQDAEYQRKGTEVLDKLGRAEASPYAAKHAAHFRKLLGGGGTSAPEPPAP